MAISSHISFPLLLAASMHSIGYVITWSGITECVEFEPPWMSHVFAVYVFICVQNSASPWPNVGPSVFRQNSSHLKPNYSQFLTIYKMIWEPFSDVFGWKGNLVSTTYPLRCGCLAFINLPLCKWSVLYEVRNWFNEAIVKLPSTRPWLISVPTDSKH